MANKCKKHSKTTCSTCKKDDSGSYVDTSIITNTALYTSTYDSSSSCDSGGSFGGGDCGSF